LQPNLIYLYSWKGICMFLINCSLFFFIDWILDLISCLVSQGSKGLFLVCQDLGYILEKVDVGRREFACDWTERHHWGIHWYSKVERWSFSPGMISNHIVSILISWLISIIFFIFFKIQIFFLVLQFLRWFYKYLSWVWNVFLKSFLCSTLYLLFLLICMLKILGK
jgi:hypothetical protein